MRNRLIFIVVGIMAAMQLPASIAQAAQQSGTFNNYEDTTWTGKICVMVKASGQVSKAEFILDGNVKETQTDTSKYSSECGNLSAFYKLFWDSRDVVNGEHKWTVKLYDSSGSVVLAQTFSGKDYLRGIVNNPVPSGKFSTDNNTEVSGSFNTYLLADDNDHLSRVDLFLNDKLQISYNAGGSPLKGGHPSNAYLFQWDTTKVADGAYVLTAKLYDLIGNQGSANLRVIVKNSKGLNQPLNTCRDKLQEINQLLAGMVGRTSKRIDFMTNLDQEVQKFYVSKGVRIDNYSDLNSKVEKAQSDAEDSLVTLEKSSLINCDNDLGPQIQAFETALKQSRDKMSAYKSAIQQLIDAVFKETNK